MMRRTGDEAGWTRTDDQILKAGVMKYGFNKWGKIASLLDRDAKACRSRFEDVWQRPAGSWSADEKLKLLELLELFSYQYELVGTALKRPAAQCYAMHSQICLGCELTGPAHGSRHEQSADAQTDQIVLEFAKDRLKNTHTRKDLKRMRRNQKNRRP
ncbi:hypothetical protein PAPHI01_2059 [Pancytospora philotis]|nr:hypothetical protein PAPHI01_2059 [Pancytospora philotis]